MTKRELSFVGITILVMCIPMAIIAHRFQKTEIPSTAFDHSAIAMVKTKVAKNANFATGQPKRWSNWRYTKVPLIQAKWHIRHTSTPKKN